MPLALAGVLGALTFGYAATGEAVHLLHLYPLAIAAPWLVAVDADVHRLPYRTTMLTLVASVLGVVATAALTGTWLLAAAAALGWALSYGLFWVLNKAGRGGLGYGDVRLAGLIGLTTAPLSASTTWLAFLLGTLTAAGWAFTRPRQPGSRHASGPWLLLGWLAATLHPLGRPSGVLDSADGRVVTQLPRVVLWALRGQEGRPTATVRQASLTSGILGARQAGRRRQEAMPRRLCPAKLYISATTSARVPARTFWYGVTVRPFPFGSNSLKAVEGVNPAALRARRSLEAASRGARVRHDFASASIRRPEFVSEGFGVSGVTRG